MSSKTLFLGKFWGKDHNGNDVVRYINKNSFVCDTFEYAKTNATNNVDLLEYECKRETNFYTKELGWSNLQWEIISVKVDEESITENKMESRKNDADKTRFELIPPDALEEIAKVFTYGANKYAPNNWKGLDKDRLIGALYRHMNAYQQGEWLDKEMGLPHLAAVAVNAIMLLSLGNNIEVDLSEMPKGMDVEQYLKLKRLGLNPIHFNINQTKDPLYDKHCEEEKQAYTLFSDIKDYVICDLEYNLLFTGNLEECREYYRRVFYGDISKAYFLDRQLYIDGAIKRNILLPKSE